VDTAEVYQCPICQLHFHQKSVQQQCEAWCRTHPSCHLQIASQSLEANTAQARVKPLRKEQASNATETPH
jgi:hypothetical protein